MHKIILFCLLCLTFTACVPSQTTLDHRASNDIIGIWQDERGDILAILDDTNLSLPNKTDCSGLTYKVQGNKLITVSLVSPNQAKTESEYTIIRLSGNQLVLEDSQAKKHTFYKKENITHIISGQAMYRERMALPPESYLSLILRDNLSNEIIATKLKPLLDQGSIIEFELVVDQAKLKTKSTYSLESSIIFQDTTLFSASNPVSINNERVEIILTRSLANEAKPSEITAPILYSTKQESNLASSHLFLEANGFYILERKTAQDTSPQYHLGRWHQVDRGHNIQLTGQNEPFNLVIRPSESLVFVDVQDNTELFPSKNSVLPSQAITFTGYYYEEKGQSYLQEHNSELFFKLEGDLTALKAAQSKTKSYVELQAIISRDSTQKDPKIAPFILNVQEFKKLENTEFSKDTMPITNSYWRLIELNTQKVILAEDNPEVHIIFKDKGELSGSDGCNVFFGSYKNDATKLNIGEGGATLRMCEPSIDAQALQFKQSLNKTQEYRIQGKVLELLDENKKVLASFESVPL